MTTITQRLAAVITTAAIALGVFAAPARAADAQQAQPASVGGVAVAAQRYRAAQPPAAAIRLDARSEVAGSAAVTNDASARALSNEAAFKALSNSADYFRGALCNAASFCGRF